jgi:hypothetical protein
VKFSFRGSMLAPKGDRWARNWIKRTRKFRALGRPKGPRTDVSRERLVEIQRQIVAQIHDGVRGRLL